MQLASLSLARGYTNKLDAGKLVAAHLQTVRAAAAGAAASKWSGGDYPSFTVLGAWRCNQPHPRDLWQRRRTE